MKIGEIKILLSRCTEGIYLRWYWNGWHYFLFTNGYEIQMDTESMGTQTTKFFSVISKTERPTRLKAEYSYNITVEGITAANIPGFTGLLMAEKVEQYEDLVWREVEITRGEHPIKDEDTNGYIFNFQVTRKELPITSAVYQKSLKLYLGDTLCDLDDDEVVPINKQTNDIAEMQDRQSDFTAQFRVRKTRAMRSLFELSGEVGANTSFPYQNQACRLIQDNIEVITSGLMILDKVDDQYYHVSILSGNMNFFKITGEKKITEITSLASHVWNITAIKVSHDASPEPDYLYPLCEPSDDAEIAPLRLVGNTIEMYGGFIWPFIKVRTIWEAIFSEAGFICEGDILSDPRFDDLYMPISSLKVTKGLADKYLYSVYWSGAYNAVLNDILGFIGAILINGDENFRIGYYYLPFTATYKISVMAVVAGLGTVPTLGVYKNGGYQGDMTFIGYGLASVNYEYEIAGTAGQHVEILTSAALYYYYSVAITEIKDAKIAYSSTVVPAYHLPDMSQTDFIKLICNMFGLIPETIPRDRKVKFWNYTDLYDNIAIARDWSAYLSERDDETEFKFGDYAQSNNLKYKESDDVLKDNGKGIMQVDDETLPFEKDIIELPVSTCDEVIIATTAPTVTVSRIAFNKYDNKANAYAQNDTIDPRIVYSKRADGKSFIVWDDVTMIGNHVDIDDPRIACSLEVSFSQLVVNYASLSRMLTKTNLRSAKFNLPVYEVAGLKHYIPIYLSQYKAYFYVNKINNYVPGQLCTIDLIKL